MALVAGAAILYLNAGNDFEGYALSENYTIDTPASAFLLWVGSPVSEARLKWIVTSIEPNQSVFAGWGAASTVNAYTGNYQYATPESGWGYTARAYYAALNISKLHVVNQNSPPLVPPQEPLWLNTATTSSSTTLYCDPNNEGDKMSMLVIMNADGSSGIKAEIQLGSRIPLYGWLPFVLIPVGLILLILGLLVFRKSKKRVPKSPAAS
ncbi:MAG: hypothetical protein NWE93_14485 [Candidatus Bathyarchaeota archaeon]|nr:hypothetical protein [Candidatus Bathyarchaeota archaeon]